MKKCPFCAEEIQDEAIKCKHCNEFLMDLKAEVKTPWYFKPSFLLLCFLTVGPLALPLVWFHPRYSRKTKIILSVIVLVVTYYLGSLFIHSLQTILDAYRQVGVF